MIKYELIVSKCPISSLVYGCYSLPRARVCTQKWHHRTRVKAPQAVSAPGCMPLNLCNSARAVPFMSNWTPARVEAVSGERDYPKDSYSHVVKHVLYMFLWFNLGVLFNKNVYLQCLCGFFAKQTKTHSSSLSHWLCPVK